MVSKPVRDVPLVENKQATGSFTLKIRKNYLEFVIEALTLTFCCLTALKATTRKSFISPIGVQTNLSLLTVWHRVITLENMIDQITIHFC